jgi:Holliday junction resolvasome RuvABC endonuclease subunit
MPEQYLIEAIVSNLSEIRLQRLAEVQYLNEWIRELEPRTAAVNRTFNTTNRTGSGPPRPPSRVVD